MITEIKVPQISANVDEITITGWFKKEGDPVRQGESLVEMTTEKASFEFESPCAGHLLKIIAHEKSILPTGYIVALIGEPGESVPDVAEANSALLQKLRDAASVKRTPARAPSLDRRRLAIKATPAARRYAREHGVDLAELAEAEGSNTVVTREMIEEFVNGRREDEEGG